MCAKFVRTIAHTMVSLKISKFKVIFPHIKAFLKLANTLKNLTKYFLKTIVHPQHLLLMTCNCNMRDQHSVRYIL